MPPSQLCHPGQGQADKGYKTSKNRQLKSRIRKAKTLLEVTAFASALITLEHEK